MKEHKSAKKIKMIIFSLLFLLSLNAVLYYGYMDAVWEDYNAVKTFSGNHEDFEHIVEIILKHNKKSNSIYYVVTDNGKILSYETDWKSNCEEILLVENDISSIKKSQKTLKNKSLYIKIEEYGVSFYRDEKSCRFVYVYEGVDVGDINSDFIKEPSEFLKFKNIEGNWYNVISKR